MKREDFIISATDLEFERGHCEYIKKLNSEPPVEIQNLIVYNARRHLHKKSTEYYFVIRGRGSIILDGQEYEIKTGDLITILPRRKHRLVKNGDEFEVLVIAVPPVKDDCFFD